MVEDHGGRPLGRPAKLRLGDYPTAKRKERGGRGGGGGRGGVGGGPANLASRRKRLGRGSYGSTIGADDEEI